MRKKREISQPYDPPYGITPATLSLMEKIGEHLGGIKSASPLAQRPRLHRINRIKTVQGTLAIEGNTMSIDQVTAVLDGKRVLANPRELQEEIGSQEPARRRKSRNTGQSKRWLTAAFWVEIVRDGLKMVLISGSPQY